MSATARPVKGVTINAGSARKVGTCTSCKELHDSADSLASSPLILKGRTEASPTKGPLRQSALELQGGMHNQGSTHASSHEQQSHLV
jgi:hypothetical protein